MMLGFWGDEKKKGKKKKKKKKKKTTRKRTGFCLYLLRSSFSFSSAQLYSIQFNSILPTPSSNRRKPPNLTRHFPPRTSLQCTPLHPLKIRRTESRRRIPSMRSIPTCTRNNRSPEKWISMLNIDSIATHGTSFGNVMECISWGSIEPRVEKSHCRPSSAQTCVV